MRNIFDSLHPNFFKPLNSKYKKEYADCILRIYNTFQDEITYGVNREIVVKVLEEYFEDEDQMMTSDSGERILKDSREKANETIRVLLECGWIEYENVPDHQVNILLQEYAIPVIEAFHKIEKDEEAEYQGIISQIHASLENEALYIKPYELVLKGVFENTKRLIMELKKLNLSIKRHTERQTNQMGPSQVLDHFFQYHKNIGSKAYLRMKTSENISYFRSSIVDRLERIMGDEKILAAALEGYMEVEQEKNEDTAREGLIREILQVKSSFYHLDEIVQEIENRHNRYIRNAVARAKFLLSSGNNVESKISQILVTMVDDLNNEVKANIYQEAEEEVQKLFRLYPQRYVDGESLRGVQVQRKNKIVDAIPKEQVLSATERQLYKEALREKNRQRFTRKRIEEYVGQLLESRDSMMASELPLDSKRDLIRMVYISIYGSNHPTNYRIERNHTSIEKNGYVFPDFKIVSIQGRKQ